MRSALPVAALAELSRATVQLPCVPTQPVASTTKFAKSSGSGLAATVASLMIVQE